MEERAIAEKSYRRGGRVPCSVMIRIFFHRGYILFMGRPGSLPLHAHSAAAVCAGLEGDIKIRTGADDWTRCRSAVIASGCEHALETRDVTFVTLLLEPQAECPTALAPLPDAGIDVAHPFSARLIETASWLNDDRPDASVAEKLESLLESPTHETGDARIRQAIEILLSEHELSGAELARRVGVSQSWLAHNFKKQTGVSLPRFKIWFRLKTAAHYLGQGFTLVDAALEAGFYDQAHFSNAFRDVFGIQPGIVFDKAGPIRVYMSDRKATLEFLALSGR